MSLRHVSLVAMPETTSAVKAVVNLALPKKPGSPQATSMRGEWSALDWFIVWIFSPCFCTEKRN